MTQTSHRKSQTGITLIELMIALLIGAFLLAGILQIFINTRQSYRVNEGLSRLQENARFALELLDHDVRLSGNLGCTRISTSDPVVIANNPLVAPHANAGNATVVAASIVTGGNGGTTGSFTTPNPALSTSPLNSVVQNTDAITVQFAESCNGVTTAVMSTVNPSAISATHTCGVINLGTGTTAVTLGTPLVISDCNTTHIFRASSGTNQNKDATGAATSALGKTYLSGSEIMLFRSYTYFIRENSGSQPALYRLDNNLPTAPAPVAANDPPENPVELVEGIEDMQILYGEDVNNDSTADYYVSANSVADMANVVSIHVTLTARTADANLATTGDGRIKRDFTSTISLRNRLP